MSDHSKTRKKLEKSFKEVLDENKDKISFIDNKAKEIENSLNIIKDNYLEHIKGVCSNQFKWLEGHATVFSNPNGIHVHINDNPDSITAEAVLTELDACIRMNDRGLKDYFFESNNKKSVILKENEKCMAKCAFGADDKTEKEIKSCISDCFLHSFQETKDLLNDITNRVNVAKTEFQV